MAAVHSSKEELYYTDTDVARLLDISVGRLRNKLTAGSPLPPRIQPPGCRNRLWSRKAVHEWLEQFTIMTTDHPVHYRTTRPRGRPTSYINQGRNN